jgi:hypothetical protein
LAQGEQFVINVIKRFGHDVHGLAFQGRQPAALKQLDASYGEVIAPVMTDSVGGFDVHVPYLGDAEKVTIARHDGTEEVEIPVRQRRMTFAGLVFEPVPVSVAGLTSDQDEVGQVFLVR